MSPYVVLTTVLSPLLLFAQGVTVSFLVAALWPVVLLEFIVVVDIHGLLCAWP
jgi:hypothetical protein